MSTITRSISTAISTPPMPEAEVSTTTKTAAPAVVQKVDVPSLTPTSDGVEAKLLTLSTGTPSAIIPQEGAIGSGLQLTTLTEEFSSVLQDAGFSPEDTARISDGVSAEATNLMAALPGASEDAINSVFDQAVATIMTPSETQQLDRASDGELAHDRRQLKDDKREVKNDHRDAHADRKGVRQDKHEIKLDKKEIRNDRAELKKDKQALADLEANNLLGINDAAIADMKKEIEQDKKDLKADREDLKQDKKDLRKDQGALEGDIREGRNDERDMRRDQRELRSDRGPEGASKEDEMSDRKEGRTDRKDEQSDLREARGDRSEARNDRKDERGDRHDHRKDRRDDRN